MQNISQPIHILHLDDSVRDAELVRDRLEADGLSVDITRARDQKTFEAALDSQSYDVILCDYNLPHYSGISALTLAREKQPDAPVIIISGMLGEEEAVKCLQAGATDYLLKQRLERLVPAVRRALTAAEDYRKRREAEASLRDSEERFRQITENVADMIAVLDLDGHRVYNNPAYTPILGSPDSLRGTDSFQEIHPDDRERVRRVFFDTVRTGIGHRTEYRFLRSDGHVRYIESQGSVIRQADGTIANVLVVSRDVTERREAEHQIRDQAALLDKAQDAIITTDLTHRIAYWNASAERIYGWTAAEVFGRNLQELGLGYADARFANARQQVLATGEWRGEFQVRAKDGHQVQVESTWSLVVSPEGRAQSILLIDTDVTERRKMEIHLLRTQRMESIATLTGGIAHDLNNVLAPIVMGADILRSEITSEASLRVVNSIEISAQHGAALVRQLLGFARGEEGQRVEVRPQSLLEDLAPLLRQALPSQIEVQVRLAPNPWPVFADATQLKQVIFNLAINARDAMPAGGTLTIAAENLQFDAEQARAVPDGRAGRFLRLRVSDTGTGIPPEILEKIFDPFFTTKEVGKGTGLGLSTVRGIIKGHEGFLQVESTIGLGTAFNIFLPVFQTSSTSAAPFPTVGRAETILVIDGDRGVREMLQAFLERHRYRVLAAGDAAAGLETIRQEGATIAAVITNVPMPGSSGTAMVAAMRHLAPAAPILVVGGDETVLGHGTVAVLGEPLDPLQLLVTLRRMLDSASIRPGSPQVNR
jgi:PAS domain S-box-containing protein